MLGRGSEWLRWEPHIHAPGTVLNDQFGKDAWEEYLSRLENASPTLRAIGVTDYYTTATYELVKAEKERNNRLPNCELIFPNIELRLALGTHKGSWVNVHLLVSPTDPDHVVNVNLLLGKLRFTAHGEEYGCTPQELMRLGRKVTPSVTNDRQALEVGVVQYKVNFNELLALHQKSDWARENILIAVAGGADGSSGLRDAADATIREEIEKGSHLIFSANEGDRDFWLGRKASATASDIRSRFGALKPVLWGSDAHTLAKVATPDLNRYSWVRGAAPTFDSLRQACIDPTRAFVGETPPSGAMSSQAITRVQINNAPWMQTPDIGLNTGLVAIIGARGSGKTALADMIALGADAFPEAPNSQSFLTRANADGHLAGAVVEVHWEDGDPSVRRLDLGDEPGYQRARYLSQQFVDDLCSSTGMTDALLGEIERVVFQAHPSSDTEGANNFAELLHLKADRFRQAREREESALGTISERIGNEREKIKLVASLKLQISDKNKQIAAYKAERAKLIPNASDSTAQRLGEVLAAAEKVRGYLRFFAGQQAALQSVRDEVTDHRKNRAPEALRSLQERHKQARISEDDWKNFLLNFVGDVDAAVEAYVNKSSGSANSWKGKAPPPLADPKTPFVTDDADLTTLPLAVLEAEIARLEKLVAADRDTASKLAALSKKLLDEGANLEALEERLADCEGARQRAIELTKEREEGYQRVFAALLSEEQVLRDLYAPLMERLRDATGSVKRITFSVSRTADVDRWAKRGEDLLDARKNPFKGVGTLAAVASSELSPAWEGGDAGAAATAMAEFRDKHQEEMLGASKISKTEQDYRVWSRQFAQWLYGTDHISLKYSIDYDGIDIRRLSPGTRGIVLLLLYLALDDADDRPLIIDQPEENLDPKSIFDELVGLFQAAKAKRQVIIVTHNANLVVNVDADQIIVASVGPHAAGELPPITYVSGGLDEQPIRRLVCDILEGGETAFKERARRLRVALDR